jgi:hypothetical protein
MDIKHNVAADAVGKISCGSKNDNQPRNILFYKKLVQFSH